MTRITIDLPDPDHSVGVTGLRHLTGYGLADVDDPVHPNQPKVEFEGMSVHLGELERFALAMLWMVRGHPAGKGLKCEVPAVLDETDENHIVNALLMLGLWDEIDGDGTAASIIADHILAIPRLLRDATEVAEVMPGGGHA